MNDQIKIKVLKMRSLLCALMLITAVCPIFQEQIDGIYRVTEIGSQATLQTIFVEIQQRTIIVQGCSISTASFLFNPNKSFTVRKFSQDRSGEICKNEADSRVIGAIEVSTLVEKLGTVITFRDSNGVETLRIKEQSINQQNLFSKSLSLLTPVTLISFQISGIYEFFIQGFSDTIFYGTITSEEFVLQGCNTHKFSYNAYSDGKIRFTGLKSTLRQCVTDYDEQILSAISKITNYRESNNQQNPYQFFQGQNFRLKVAEFIFNQKIPANVLQVGANVNIITYPSQNFQQSLQGVYQLAPKHLQVFIRNKILYFPDESGIQFTFVQYGQNRIQFTQKIGNGGALSADQQIIRQLILKSEKYQVTPYNTIQFFSQNHDLTFTIINLLNSRPIAGRLNGRYEVQIPPQVAVMEINAFQIFVQGCNKFELSYEADVSGNIQVDRSYEQQTFKECGQDYDQIFIQSLIVSKYYRLKGDKKSLEFSKTSDFYWLSANAKFTEEISSPLETQVFGQKILLIEEEKTFIIKILNSNIPDQTLKTYPSSSGINTFEFSGCNTYTGEYQAFSNTGIRLTNIRPKSTLRSSCGGANFDDFYIRLLRQSTYFRVSQLGYLFFYNNKDYSILQLEPKN